jgi:hypothetical protein
MYLPCSFAFSAILTFTRRSYRFAPHSLLPSLVEDNPFASILGSASEVPLEQY